MSSIFNKIQTILVEHFSFQSNQIQLETKFELELGMDSREMIELVKECEQTFNIKINLDDIDTLVSKGNPIIIQDLVTYIKKKVKSNS